MFANFSFHLTRSCAENVLPHLNCVFFHHCTFFTFSCPLPPPHSFPLFSRSPLTTSALCPLHHSFVFNLLSTCPAFFSACGLVPLCLCVIREPPDFNFIFLPSRKTSHRFSRTGCQVAKTTFFPLFSLSFTLPASPPLSPTSNFAELAEKKVKARHEFMFGLPVCVCEVDFLRVSAA